MKRITLSLTAALFSVAVTISAQAFQPPPPIFGPQNAKPESCATFGGLGGCDAHPQPPAAGKRDQAKPYVATSGAQQADATTKSVDRPELACGYMGTSCTTLTVELPPVAASSNVSTQVVKIRYFMSYLGSADLAEVPANQEWAFEKMYAATQRYKSLANGKTVLVITAVFKNWSNRYSERGRIDVEWRYVQPDHE